jgi:pimeloyl-ACP methyl ester carboxylesterase
MKKMRALVRREAAAYVRSGLLAASGTRGILSNRGSSEFGVVFVPGVGANATQFGALKEALDEDVRWFDAFEYWSVTHPKRITEALRAHLLDVSARCGRVLAIGHSLGGLLLRMALQADPAPACVSGFVSICAPLHGTWRSRLALAPGLRALSPDGALLREVYSTADRLNRLKGSVLAVGVLMDSFVSPAESAFIDGHARLLLEDVGHVGALFDRRVHQAVVNLARQVRDR